MRTTPAASLLVAALVMLRQPSARSQATARLLLERAAEHTGLSPAEREACLNVVDAIDAEHAVLTIVPGQPYFAPHSNHDSHLIRLTRRGG